MLRHKLGGARRMIFAAVAAGLLGGGVGLWAVAQPVPAARFAPDNDRYLYGRNDAFSHLPAGLRLGPAAGRSAERSKAGPSALDRPPNVIVILADDLGRGDVSSYGGGRVPTPNIDRIAQSGVAFSSGYVTASVCAPSRAGLLTGRYQQRFGFEHNIAETEDTEDAERGLPATETILPEYLKKAGYATALVGKWHQGFSEGQYPTRRGFDDFFGFIPGTMTYARPDDPTIQGFVAGGRSTPRPDGAVLLKGENRTRVSDPTYMTEQFTREAVGFIRENRERPFFLYLAHHAPHVPFQAPARIADRFKGVESKELRVIFGMIASLDEGVGEVLDTLEETGLRENTIIVFASDNGCAIGFGYCGCDTPINAGKFTQLEGGVRVPFLVSWPARIRQRGVVDTPVSTLDVAATVLKAAGVQPRADRPLDGKDLLQVLAAPEASAERPLYWRQGVIASVRIGRWKLWRNDRDGDVKLYDLAADPGETVDLAGRERAVVKRLGAQLTSWERGLAPLGAEPRERTPPALICRRWTTRTY